MTHERPVLAHADGALVHGTFENDGFTRKWGKIYEKNALDKLVSVLAFCIESE